jgi:hypothetical protein
VKKMSVIVYRVAEVYTVEVEALNHTEANLLALRRVKQRLVKPMDVNYNLVSLSIDGAHMGVGTEQDDHPHKRKC